MHRELNTLTTQFFLKVFVHVSPCVLQWKFTPTGVKAQRLSAKDSTVPGGKCKMKKLDSAASKRTWILLCLIKTRWKGEALLQYNIRFSLIIVIAWEVHYIVQLFLTWKRSFRYSLHNYTIIKAQPKTIKFCKRFFQQFLWNSL